MTVSCSIYATGEDPFTGKKVPVTYKLSDMRHQKDLIMWWLDQQPHPHHDRRGARR
jgi:hypothetical protein